MKTVAVFFGGKSNESEISVITGIYAVNLLRGAGYRVLPVYLTEEGGMVLNEGARAVEDFKDVATKKFAPVRFVRGGLAYEKRNKKIAVDCALNCCHGGMGEGGELSALFDWHGILSASPQMPASAVFLDKALSKLVLKGLGIPVVPSMTLQEAEWCRGEGLARIEELGYPVIVKPSKLGSSVGISVASNAEELNQALALCFRLDPAALIEKYMSGKRDLNCAAYRLGEEIVLSPVEEVFSSAPILTFGEKYEGAGRTSKLPAEIPAETAERVGEYLRCVYEAFGIQGMVRADFLLVEGELYFNELNTVPGTLATYLFGESLLTARNLLKALVEDAISRGVSHKETVKSGILDKKTFGGKSAKRR